ncbi:MAG: hypothetical protein RMJ51_03295 [Candidatus Calescibacterium sp.]|nr:hypothetical protein [Candidatus Calescibacterium sp.]MCX7972826.1 hypothetical protein [bacterium]MDW8195252.1 hypothetical protein [Candidatus Calescibacterium sp.]
MQKYLEIFELLQEYITQYNRLMNQQKIDKYTCPLILQYRSEIQEIIAFIDENKDDISFNLYQEFQKIIQNLQEYDNKLVQLLPEIKRMINLNHYRTKYPKDHWWWYL